MAEVNGEFVQLANRTVEQIGRDMVRALSRRPITDLKFSIGWGEELEIMRMYMFVLYGPTTQTVEAILASIVRDAFGRTDVSLNGLKYSYDLEKRELTVQRVVPTEQCPKLNINLIGSCRGG